jgi:hypothetical protein
MFRMILSGMEHHKATILVPHKTITSGCSNNQPKECNSVSKYLTDNLVNVSVICILLTWPINTYQQSMV